MNKEELKHLATVLEACSEDKTIQFKQDNGEWKDIVIDNLDSIIMTPMNYRIKLESKLRPYTYAELSEALKQHGALVRRNYEYITFITFADIEHVFINKSPALRYADLMDYNWLDDDSPCGVIYCE